LKPIRAPVSLYAEVLVVAILGFVFLLGWFLYDFLRAWYMFIGSYLVSRAVIWFVADVLKARLMLPLKKAKERRMSLQIEKFDSRGRADRQQDSKINYSKMDDQQLRGVLDSNEINSMSDDRFRLFQLAFIYKVQKKIHIHHFILGIPLMPVTWILYFYNVTWGPVFYPIVPWGMGVAGFTFALFMSEFWQLLTQEWGP